MTRKQMNAAARRIPWGQPLPDDVAAAMAHKVARQVRRTREPVKALRRAELRLAMGIRPSDEAMGLSGLAVFVRKAA